MTVVDLAPSSTVANSGTRTGGSNVHGVLSDGSDSTYMLYGTGQESWVGLTDLTLPAGAEVVRAQVFARSNRVTAFSGAAAIWSKITLPSPTEVVDTVQFVTWTAATTVGGVLKAGDLNDTRIDGAGLVVNNPSTANELRVYEAFLRVLYYVKPTVDVDTPTGTVNTNQLEVTWTPTFDPDSGTVFGGDDHLYEIRVFNDTQYGIGGFDPSTSPCSLEATGQTHSDASHLFYERLPDDDYRAYVRVASTDRPDFKSDWAYNAFTLDAAQPGVPLIAATADDANGRITVALDDQSGDVATTSFELQRSDDGVNFVDVRTANGDGVVTPSGGNATVYDYEAPNGVTVTYRARAYNQSNVTFSDWATDTEQWASDAVWLKHATRPSLNLSFILRSYPSSSTASSQGVFRPLGSSDVIVVSDKRGPETGQIVLLTEEQVDRDALEALLDVESPVLIQVPVANETPQRWVVFAETSTERLFDKGFIPYNDETLSWTRVVRPTGPLEE